MLKLQIYYTKSIKDSILSVAYHIIKLNELNIFKYKSSITEPYNIYAPELLSWSQQSLRFSSSLDQTYTQNKTRSKIAKALANAAIPTLKNKTESAS